MEGIALHFYVGFILFTPTKSGSSIQEMEKKLLRIGFILSKNEKNGGEVRLLLSLGLGYFLLVNSGAKPEYVVILF